MVEANRIHVRSCEAQCQDDDKLDAPENCLSPQEAVQRKTVHSHPKAGTSPFLEQRAFPVSQCDVHQEGTPVVSLESSNRSFSKQDRFSDVSLPL